MHRVAGRRRVQPGWGLQAAALAVLLAALAHPPASAQDESVAVAQAGPVSERPQPRLSLVLAAPLPGESDRTLPGLRWRQPLGGQVVDITAWHRLPPPSDAASLIRQREPAFGARVEMHIASSRGLMTDYKFIGLQLDGGARIGLRRKDGGPTLYYRSQF